MTQNAGFGYSNFVMNKKMRVCLSTLPLEIIWTIERFLQLNDLVQFYTSRNLIATYTTMKPFILKKLSNWNVKKRKYCAQCRHDAISCVEWKNRLKRDWIPWCTIHVNPCILNDIEFYCIGSIDIQGQQIIRIEG